MTDRNEFGLTPAEEAALAREYAETAAKTPTRQQMAEYRALGAALRAARTAEETSDEFDVDAAARAHHAHLMGHDLTLTERRDRARALVAAASGDQIGNDGLTDAERAEYARRWHDGAGRKPTKDEMQHYRTQAEAHGLIEPGSPD